MEEIGAYKAKTNLGQILKRVERGEQVAITVNGRRVARLIPEPPAEDAEVSGVLEALRTFAARHGVKPATAKEIKEWVNEGRRR